MTNLLWLLDKVSIWIVFVPVVIGIFFIKYLNKDSRAVLAIAVFASFPQAIHEAKMDKEIINITYNAYTATEFVLWLIIFKSKFSLKSSRLAFKVSVVFYCIGAVVLNLFFSFSKRFISEWVCINNLLFTFWILLFLMEQLYNDQIDFSFKKSFTWYITFALLYCSCTFLVFSSWSYSKNDIAILKMVKVLHNIFNICLYLGFCGGFLSDYKNKVNFAPNERPTI